MSWTLNGTNQNASVSPIDVSDLPVTISVWVKNSGLGSASSVYLCMGVSGSSNNWVLIRSNASKAAQCEEKDTSASPFNSYQNFNNDQSSWHLIVGVFTSHSSRTVCLDGVYGPTDGTVKTASGFNMFSFGSNAAPGNYLTGKIAHAAVWNTSLTSGQINSLLYLYPNQVQVANLVHYWPMLDSSSPATDYGSGNLSLTLSNSPTFSTDNPNIAGTLVQTLMGASG